MAEGIQPVQFHLQIRVIEARSLAGDKVNSYGRIDFGGKSRRTQVRKFTNDPVWDRTLSFRCTTSLQELCRLPVKFSVYNQRRLRLDDLMGSCSLVLQDIYMQPNHCFPGQWLTLIGKTSGDLVGYLKIFATVTGPGETAPLYQVTDGESEDDVWDTTEHQNVILLNIALLKAEMPPLVQFVLKVTVAGKSLWTQEGCSPFPVSMGFPIRWPTISRHIVISLGKSTDAPSMATGTIAINDCSRPKWSGDERGFLPVFGPAYVNLYDGPHYHGRICVELKSFTSAPMLSNRLLVDPNPFPLALHTEIIGATVIAEEFKDQMVHFEVTIGNQGSSKACTKQEKPVSNGLNLFMPWANRHDIVIPVGFAYPEYQERAETSNFFRRIAADAADTLAKLTPHLKLMPEDQMISSLVALVDRLLTPVFRTLWADKTKMMRNWMTPLDKKIKCLRDVAVEQLEVDLAEQREKKAMGCAQECLSVVQSVIQRLENVAKDPQLDLPDIIVKMFTAEDEKSAKPKLVAYTKIPVHEVLFSLDSERQGFHCNRLCPVHLKWLDGKKRQADKLPCALQLKMWMGLEGHFKAEDHSLSHCYQLWAYLIGGRDLYPANRNGLSNSFVRVSYWTYSQQTQVVKDTVNPEWMETLIFKTIKLTGTPEELKKNPPRAILEVFDWDPSGQMECIGRTLASPQVRTDVDNRAVLTPQNKPVWLPLGCGDTNRGELLVAFELYQADDELLLPEYPNLKNSKKFGEKGGKVKGRFHVKPVFKVPRPIRPATAIYYLEALLWGVRDLKSAESMCAIQLQCGNRAKTTTPIDLRETLNFSDPIKGFLVELPKDPVFMPPIIFNLLAKTDLIGSSIVTDPTAYLHQKPKSFAQERSLDVLYGSHLPRLLPAEDVSEAVVEPELDWWSKFYAANDEADKSPGFQSGGNKPLHLLKQPLEETRPYRGFNEFCDTFIIRKIARGKTFEHDEEKEKMGELRAQIHLYLCQDGKKPANTLASCKDSLPSSAESCLVRVYLIRALSLSTANRSGTANPYVTVKCGKQKKSGEDIPGSLDPIFGQVLEFPVVNIPTEKTLKIQIWDKNLIFSDELIGETKIDLENRLLTKFRATVGLSPQFCTRGPYMWRDQQQPLQILFDYCRTFSLPQPKWLDSGRRVKWGEMEFSLKQFESDFEREVNKNLSGSADQRLALQLLRLLSLVPEHVETRPISLPEYPLMECGKIQLFVDIFPLRLGTPTKAINIRPRQGIPYQLRLTVFDTLNVARETHLCGDEVVDVFVKCFLRGLEDSAKETDVNYGSLDGSGEFNSRFLFNFEYLAAEQLILVKKQRHIGSSKTREEKFPVELVMELCDNRKLRTDHRLGKFIFNLLKFDEPIQPEYFATGPVDTVKWICCCPCRLWACQKGEDQQKILYEPQPIKTSVFDGTVKRGYWPAVRLNEWGRQEVAGYVQLEMELLTRAEAARKPLTPLANPRKQGYLMSRLKGVMRGAWRSSRNCLYGAVILLLIGLIVVLFK